MKSLIVSKRTVQELIEKHVAETYKIPGNLVEAIVIRSDKSFEVKYHDPDFTREYRVILDFPRVYKYLTTGANNSSVIEKCLKEDLNEFLNLNQIQNLTRQFIPILKEGYTATNLSRNIISQICMSRLSQSMPPLQLSVTKSPVKWISKVFIGIGHCHLGEFKTRIEAIETYKIFIHQIYGEILEDNQVNILGED